MQGSFLFGGWLQADDKAGVSQHHMGWITYLLTCTDQICLACCIPMPFTYINPSTYQGLTGLLSSTYSYLHQHQNTRNDRISCNATGLQIEKECQDPERTGFGSPSHLAGQSRYNVRPKQGSKAGRVGGDAHDAPVRPPLLSSWVESRRP